MPGCWIDTVPDQAHAQVQPSVSAGIPSTVTEPLPGDHGATSTGTQGCGVSTPNAAAVASATWGFAAERHAPKGATFVTGLKS